MDRLSRGYSTKDTAKAKKLSLAKEKHHILQNQKFIYKEENPHLCLINRMQQLQELSKEAKILWAETKLGNKLSSKLPGTALKQQVPLLGLEVPVMKEENCKFYSKGEL